MEPLPQPGATLYSVASAATALGWLAAVLYLFGLATLLFRLRRPGRLRSDLFDHLAGLLGFVAHVAALVLRARELGRFPVGTLEESVAFLACLLAGAYVLAATRFGYPAVEALLLALVSAFQLLSIALPGAARRELPSLASRWFVFHTMLSFLGVAALFSAGAVSILYLLADSDLKRKRPGTWLKLLPSLVSCDRTALRLLAFGFPLLSLGLVTGWLWSREAGTWSLGPKELLATVAWLLYGLALMFRWLRGWQGRKAAILSVMAGVAALGAILGIRL